MCQVEGISFFTINWILNSISLLGGFVRHKVFMKFANNQVPANLLENFQLLRSSEIPEFLKPIKMMHFLAHMVAYLPYLFWNMLRVSWDRNHQTPSLQVVLFQQCFMKKHAQVIKMLFRYFKPLYASGTCKIIRLVIMLTTVRYTLTAVSGCIKETLVGKFEVFCMVLNCSFFCKPFLPMQGLGPWPLKNHPLMRSKSL